MKWFPWNPRIRRITRRVVSIFFLYFSLASLNMMIEANDGQIGVPIVMICLSWTIAWFAWPKTKQKKHHTTKRAIRALK